MLLSLILTFASLAPSWQAQATTQVTETAGRLVAYSRPSFGGELQQKILESMRRLKESIEAQPGDDSSDDSSDTDSWMLPEATFEETLRELKRVRKEIEERVCWAKAQQGMK